MTDQNNKWLIFYLTIFYWVIITLRDEYHLYIYIYISHNCYTELSHFCYSSQPFLIAIVLSHSLLMQCYIIFRLIHCLVILWFGYTELNYFYYSA
jgi:hypothetical protein